MPASWAKAFAPTTALLGGTETPVMESEQTAGGVNLFECDVRAGAIAGLAGTWSATATLLEGSVAGALADSCPWCIPPGAHPPRWRRANWRPPAEVIVTVGAENRRPGRLLDEHGRCRTYPAYSSGVE